MTVFDLHCHPSFKSSLLNDDLNQCPTPIDFVDIQIKAPLGLGPCLEKVAGDSLDSQSSFGQIPGGSLVVASFLAFERVYAFVEDLKRVKNLGKNVFQNMKDEKDSYFDILTNRDVAHFLTFLSKKSGLRQYQLVQSIADYPANPDVNTVYVVVSIEGGHNFYVQKKLLDQEQGDHPQEIIEQLKFWKRHSADPLTAGQFPRLLYITMTHHGQNLLANHAWAIPIRFAGNTVDVGSFDPTGNGLSEVGEQFLRTALSEEAGQKRILIDVKHLGLASRKRVYEIMEKDFPTVPILATHMGVTGTSWDQPPFERIDSPADHPQNMVVSYQPSGGFLREIPPTDSDHSGLTSIKFNTWSINLYDEDIIRIMRSGGLIGVSMDRRILGAVGVEPERFSRHDFPKNWLTMEKPTLPPKGKGMLYPTKALPNQFDGNQSKVQQDLWAFCQNVIHLVLITELAKGNADPESAVSASIDPWDHICLGSDFDGLVSAIKTCPTSEQLPHFFGQRMKATLEAMAAHLNTSPFIVNPIEIPADVIDRLSFKNGLNFLKKHFN
ncbi:hypothetical protein [Larkinella rosea]|uniref:Peptidase M19 n=1 Tax=Larkinella rosea TaxID=2025312 RepID=A0A3P1BG84_9BACT|nr:hypothetical protein [Larkinella rosea]RRA99875.1 hypothetical protein EHT25_24905 [Larkinella rosea]